MTSVNLIKTIDLWTEQYKNHYELTTDTEKFVIEHKCAFINALRTRLIPIQENSRLTS